jgi:hypothetical protein
MASYKDRRLIKNIIRTAMLEAGNIVENSELSRIIVENI